MLNKKSVLWRGNNDNARLRRKATPFSSGRHIEQEAEGGKEAVIVSALGTAWVAPPISPPTLERQGTFSRVKQLVLSPQMTVKDATGYGV